MFLVCTRILQSPNAYGIYVIAMSIEADNKLNNMNERKTRLENSHLSMTMTARNWDHVRLHPLAKLVVYIMTSSNDPGQL